MAINYPDSLDTLSNPDGTSSLSNPSHSEQHSNANDAIEALQVKVGIDGSEDTNSLDYKVNNIVTTLESLGNNTDTIIELLGLEGNNDQVVTGIENKTVVDTFAKAAFGTLRYVMQFSKNAEIKTLQIDVVQDQTDLHISEIEVSSNTENALGTFVFEENSGIISLSVTPVGPTVNVRFYRTALKN